MPFKEESLEERVTKALRFHGPQTADELGIRAAPTGIPSIQVLALRARAYRNTVHDLLPNLATKTLCFLGTQSEELGLRIGRDVETGGNAMHGASVTRVLKSMFTSQLDTLAIASLHYLNEEYIHKTSLLHNHRASFFKQMQRLGYIIHHARHIPSARWTTKGFYALARVYENQRQKERVADFNGFKDIFLQQDRQWDFAGVAGKLGWSNGYAHNYAALAREAGQPLRVYVIGNNWQRLFDFGVQGLPREKRSETVAGLAYKLLREEPDCGVDDVLDRLCTIAAMVGPHNRKGALTYGCKSAELGRDEEFLKNEGLIKASRHGSQTTLKVTYAGRKLYMALGQAGRLDETGHYAHI